MTRLLYLVFLYLPDPVLYPLVGLAGRAKKLLRLLLELRSEEEIYVGSYHGEPLRVAWIGGGALKPLLLRGLFGETLHLESTRSCRPWRVRSRVDELSSRVDLVYAERNPLLRALPGCDRIPEALRAVMPVSRRNSKNYRMARSRVRKYEIEFRDFRLSRHPEKLRLFYDELYRPYISSRHGAESVESFESMKIFYAKAILRLAYRDGEAIAGSLMLVRGDTLVGCKYGVRDPKNQVHLAAETYYSGLRYAEGHDIPFIDGFHVMPFLQDPGYRYKRRWGSGVRIDRDEFYFESELYLRVARYSPGAVAFLRDHPFVCVRAGELVAVMLCAGEAELLCDEVVSLYQKHATEGIDRYELAVRRSPTAEEKGEILARCQIRDGHDPFHFVVYQGKLDSTGP